ncbi:hypothetical protein BD289DRAFT_376528 [Coniella lustricola]|uniref:Rhodopsin domain-containing protein n=1 Tax=Coniella lustricola TaxID=2025994 RepID=A0A2T2ZWP2_9PEZI|nr:hypothetical protein BD289DRAFT_376528 [Coniella lustricola]
MTLYSAAPDPLPWIDVKPTILVCWWATLFSTTIILLRVAGRFIRSEKLFTEDKMAFFCLLPLYVRMGLVHIILLFGTNNVNISKLDVTADNLYRMQVGSALVLASRFCYAATNPPQKSYDTMKLTDAHHSLWMLKNTVLEFFKRLSGLTWSRSYQRSVLAVRCLLLATFCAVVVSDLAECQPFTHYWQVLPDPGGQCRQGYANLLTIGVCNIVTDLLLVILPIPIIVTSQMSLTRKTQLILLFSMSLLPVAVTLYRMIRVIDHHGSQQLRSLCASIELLVATGVANALVLGSFVRDRGVKKRRFKYESVTGESAQGTDSDNRSRRPTVAERAWGSDHDLFRDVGFGVHPELRDIGDLESGVPPRPTPAGPVHSAKQFNMHTWDFSHHREDQDHHDQAGRGPLLPLSKMPSSSGAKKVTFFDVGGLLDDESSAGSSTIRRQSTLSSKGPQTPPAVYPAGANGFKRGSQGFLQDLGGLLGSLGASYRGAPAEDLKDGRGRGKEKHMNSISDESATEMRRLSPSISPRTEAPPHLEREEAHEEPSQDNDNDEVQDEEDEEDEEVHDERCRR